MTESEIAPAVTTPIAPAAPNAPTAPAGECDPSDPLPGAGLRRIGVIGGGQLARMMQPAAINLCLELSVLCPEPGEPAAQVIPRVQRGAHTDAQAVTAFAGTVEAVTFDHEHVPTAILHDLEANGARVRPGPAALVHAQDKIVMREKLTALGIPCPAWCAVTSAAEVESFGAANGWPIIVKTARGGYDGKGVRVVRGAADIADWLDQVAEAPLLAEAKVPFTRELAALVARTPSGVMESWPVVRTVQRDGVCFEVTAPAPDLSQADLVQKLARDVAEGLGVVGVLAVELFEVAHPETGASEFFVNELAMRPHNSGHWSQDGCVTSQFEQHLRAVAGLPLGSTAATAPYTVMVNLLGGTATDLAAGAAVALAADPEIKVHLYGKAVKPGRKVGHVNLSGDDLDDLLARAHRAASAIVDGE